MSSPIYLHIFIFPETLGIPLEFVQPLQDYCITELVTEPFTLSCQLSRAPRTPIIWTKDKRLLLPDGGDSKRVHIEEDMKGTVHRIIFDKIVETDLGVYSIQAEKVLSTARLDMRRSICLHLVSYANKMREIHFSHVFLILFLVAPTLLTTDLSSEIVMVAGTSNVIDVPFLASPKSKVTWTCGRPGDIVPSQKPRFKIDTGSGSTSLALVKVRLEDEGVYQVCIANELGDCILRLNLKVLDRPSAPRQPEAKDNTSESLILTWLPPESPGVLLSPELEPEVLEYLVECREVSSKVWREIGRTHGDLTIPVTGLEPNQNYLFRVAAMNQRGRSEFVETKPISTKLHYGRLTCNALVIFTLINSQ
ncbi:unnamed protein product [Protopolystoma xenopodis]|uniref:Fibronectin type-III domain-containing protein n=1 Tax=Protopolystoma xenopodis TaxID=117903 RepID=A0A448WEG7_9PLAT|nr:unnamed protein product [Protopolystoma xenopodis]